MEIVPLFSCRNSVQLSLAFSLLGQQTLLAETCGVFFASLGFHMEIRETVASDSTMDSGQCSSLFGHKDSIFTCTPSQTSV